MGRSSKASARLTRDRILDAAERLFSHQTASSVSISAIALEAKVSHTVVYWHFHTKSDLLIATFDRAHRSLSRDAERDDQSAFSNHLRAARQEILGTLETCLDVHYVILAIPPWRWRDLISRQLFISFG